MASKAHTVHSTGIFRGLPSFPEHDGQKYRAIVTGASGISGSAIVDLLTAAPERWEKIFAMSRRPPNGTDERVTSVAVDFFETPENIAAIFKQGGVVALVLGEVTS